MNLSNLSEAENDDKSSSYVVTNRCSKGEANDHSNHEYNASECDADRDAFEEDEEEINSRNKLYEKVEVFSDYQSALKYMETDNLAKTYNYRCEQENKLVGDKSIYHFKRNQKFPKTAYILRESNSLECSLWYAINEHKHTNVITDLDIIKKFVKQCLQDNITSNPMILKQLRNNNLPQPKLGVLNNMKYRLRQGGSTYKNKGLNEILNWCKEKASIPENENDIFCGGVNYNLDKNDKLIELNIFITTPKLLSLTKNNSEYFFLFFF